MKNDFEAIKASLSSGWKLSGSAKYYWHGTAARMHGLPDATIRASASDEAERQTTGYAHKAYFEAGGPLADMPPAFGASRAEAAARLICEAREHLKREENAKTVLG